MAINDDILKKLYRKDICLEKQAGSGIGDLEKIGLELGLTKIDFDEIAETVQEHKVRAGCA